MNLFDIIEREEIKENLRECPHAKERKALAVWPDRPELGERMVWICEMCGKMRGRC